MKKEFYVLVFALTFVVTLAVGEAKDKKKWEEYYRRYPKDKRVD